MSKRVQQFVDIANVMDGTYTTYSDVFYPSFSNKGEAFLLVSNKAGAGGSEAGSVGFTLESGHYSPSVASATSSIDLANGEEFKISFIGADWKDPNNNYNKLSDLKPITFTVPATVSVKTLNEQLDTIHVAQFGAYKDMKLSNWFEFTSTKTIRLKDGYASAAFGFKLDKMTSNFTSGNYFGKTYYWEAITNVATVSSNADYNSYVSSGNNFIKNLLRVKITASSLVIDESKISVDLVMVSKDTNITNDMEIQKILEVVISGNIGNSETIVSDPISTFDYNSEIEAVVSKTAASTTSVLSIETTFGAKTPITIDNDPSSEEHGESSSHTSLYDDLANATWYEISSKDLAADSSTETLTASKGIGPYIRVKIATDATGGISNSSVNVSLKG